jgi:hypothetical protein
MTASLTPLGHPIWENLPQCDRGSGLLDKALLLHPAKFTKKRGLRKPRMEVIVSYLSAEAARLFPTYHGRSTGFDPHSL